MAQHLQIYIDIDDFDWKILYDKFDSRNGFETLIFGMDVYEECELLDQVSKALDYDLSFIRYPEGRAFNGCFGETKAEVEEFTDLIKNLLLRIKQNPLYYTEIKYKYIKPDYFSGGVFISDLEALLSFFNYLKSKGAIQFWFEFI